MSGQRSDLGDEKEVLREALKEFQKILDKTKYYVGLAALLAEEAN
jgi:hypothetical protein